MLVAALNSKVSCLALLHLKLFKTFYYGCSFNNPTYTDVGRQDVGKKKAMSHF